MTELTKAIAALRELLAEATPGPLELADDVIWVAQPVPVAYQECCGCPHPTGECCGNSIQGWCEELEQVQIAQTNPADGRLFVEAINALPMLLDALTPAADEIETAAKAIYDLFPYDGPGVKPEWQPGGNSFKQDDARRYALAALSKGAA